MEGTLLADQKGADRGAMAGRLGRPVETALLDPGPRQRGVRGNAPVDHGDARPGPDRRSGERGSRRREERASRRLIDMIIVGLERGRDLAQRLQSVANVHFSGERQGDHPDTQIPGLFIANDPEARPLRQRKRGSVGIGHDQLALAHRLTLVVPVERFTIRANERGEPSLADFRQERRSGGDLRDGPTDAVERNRARWIDEGCRIVRLAGDVAHRSIDSVADLANHAADWREAA